MSDPLANDIMDQLNAQDPPTEPKKDQPEPAPEPEAEPAPEGEPSPEGEQPAEEPSEETPASTRDKLMNVARAIGKRIRREATGEVKQEEKETAEETVTDAVLSVGGVGMAVPLHIFGLKGFVDVPKYISQKIFTKKERNRILDAIEKAQEVIEEDGEKPNPVEQKKAALAQAIESSKHLTPEKKAEMKAKLDEIIETYGEKVDDAGENMRAEMDEALQTAIDNRIKNTEVLKQTINSMLAMSGLNIARVGVLAGFKYYERHKKVTAEMEEGKRTDSYFNEMFVFGAQETYEKLKYGDNADTGLKRTMNRAQALGTIATATGLGFLAGAEAMDEGVLSSLSESIDKFQELGATEAIKSNLAENFTRFNDLFSSDSEAEITDSAEAATETGAPTEAEPAPETEAAITKEATPASPETNTEATVAPDAAEGSSLNLEKLQMGTVAADSEHNSIIGLITSQLKANPEGFGFSGEGDVDAWANQQALTAARAEGLVRTGGDTRLATEAIGNLSVVATATEGGLDIGFVDISSDTPDVLSMDELRAEGFIYEHGNPPNPTEQLIAQIPREAPGGTGVGTVDLEDGSSINFEYASDSTDIVEGLALDNVELSAEELAQVEAMYGGTQHLLEMHQELAGQYTEIFQHNAEYLAGYHQLLETLQENNLLETAEAMETISTAEMHYYALKQFGIIDEQSETIQELKGFFTHYDKIVHFDPEADAIPPIESLNVEGVGEVSFTLDASGRPHIENFQALLENPQPSVVESAQGLLVEGWEEATEASVLESSSQIQDSATKIFVMQKALRALEGVGEGGSGEALALKQQIAQELAEYGRYLDAGNPIVQQAMADADIVVASANLSENMNSTASAGAPEKPDTLQQNLKAGPQPTPPPPVEAPPTPESPQGGSSEALKKFVGDENKIRFRYNDEGEVTAARIIGFFANKSEMTDAANEFGVPKDQLYEAFRDKGYDNDWNTQGERVMRQMVYALEQRGVLENMAEEGLQNTPEYAKLAERVRFNTDIAEGMVQRVFGGYELPKDLAPPPSEE